MKKTAITILTIVMGISFACLLISQVRYIDEILTLRRQHFEASVSRSLYEASHQLEIAEATRYLEEGTGALRGTTTSTDSTMEDANSALTQQPHQFTAKSGDMPSIETTASTSTSDKYFTKNSDASIANTRSLKEIMAKRYSYEKKLLDEVIYSILYTASDRQLEERINFEELDQILKNELSSNGIDLQMSLIHI